MTTSSVKHYELLIGGEAVDTDEVFEIRSPADEELIATVAHGSAKHADAAVAAALQAHEHGDWRLRRPAERADVLEAICEGMSDELDELVELQVRENGATIRQALAFHVGYSVSHLKYFAELTQTYAFVQSGPQVVYPTLATGTVRREPIGGCG